MSPPFQATPGRQTWAIQIATVVAGFAVAFILAELVLRVFHLAPVGGIATVNQRDFERLPGLFVPGQRLVDRRNPALPHHVTIDSLGFRGNIELPRTKAAGEIRVVLLGDSFVYGDFVDDDQTLPAQLERRLQVRCNRELRVINAGLGGSSIETASAMVDRVLPLGVDVAVLTFSENDVTDLADPIWDQLASNRAAKSHFPLSILYPLIRKSATWNLVLSAQGKLRNWRTAGVVTPALATKATDPDSVLSSLRREYRDRLLQLRDRLAQAGVPFLFAIFPSHLSVYGLGTGEQLRWVEQMAKEAGIRTVDLTPALRQDGRPMEVLYLLPYDGHPSPTGYEVTVPLLEGELATMSPLAGRCDARNRLGVEADP